MAALRESLTLESLGHETQSQNRSRASIYDDFETAEVDRQAKARKTEMVQRHMSSLAARQFLENDTKPTFARISQIEGVAPTHGKRVSIRMSERIRTDVQSTCYEQWRAGRFTIVPEDSSFIGSWDMCIIIALVLTAVVLPFEVLLLEVPPPKLYICDKILDFIFSVDIILTFNLAFAASDRTARVVYERNPFLIAKNYMGRPFSKNLTVGWFWPDVLTVIPWEMIPNMSRMKDVRFIRVLRLAKLLRLVRVIKVFRRWHTVVGFSFAVMKVSRCMVVVCAILHWLACGWAHIGMFPELYIDAEDGNSITWLSERPRSSRLRSSREVANLPLSEVYGMSLYFCTVVLTTVGFGDIKPVNDLEVGFLIVMMFMCGLTWAWVVANIVNVIQNVDVYGVTFNQTMDDLNSLMNTRLVEKELRQRVRKHLYESQVTHRHRHQLATTTWLSRGLQGELAIESGVDDVLNAVGYLQNLPHNIVVELALHFSPDLFSPNEFIMDQHALSVVCKGQLAKRGMILGKNTVIGDDMILVSEHLKDTIMPRTLTFVEVHKLSLKSLKAVCEKFSKLDRHIRKYQIRLAVRRAIVFYAAKKSKDIKKAERAARRASSKDNLEKPMDRENTQGSNWESVLASNTADSAWWIKNDLKSGGKMGWTDSIYLGKGARLSKVDEVQSVVKEVKTLRASIDEMNARSGATEKRLNDLRNRVLQSEVSSQQRLEGLEKRFDFMTDMATSMLTLKEQWSQEVAVSKNSPSGKWWPLSPKTRPSSPNTRKS